MIFINFVIRTDNSINYQDMAKQESQKDNFIVLQANLEKGSGD